jgi:hypothetical protein
MIVVPDYKGHRIEIDAIADGTRWNADVRIRRTLLDERPHVERVTCLKLTASLAESGAEIRARRWIDLHLLTRSSQ